jgi:isopentenyldiphosphate isomerase
LSAEELVDVLDAQGNVIGVTTRADMRARHLPHRCVYILVFNRRGELFIHQRTPTKDVFPGHWDVAIGGVVAAGESFDLAASREGAEEIGVPLAVEALFPFSFSDARTTAFAHVYRGLHDGPFRLQKEEIVQGCFVSPSEVETRSKAAPFCPDSLAVWAEFKQRGFLNVSP